MGRHFASSRSARSAGISRSPNTAGSGTTNHIGGLDGVRGLAVMAVVAYHLGFGWARGGYLGVDTFLVLSGYLITSGLLSEQERTGRIRLGAFWARRARRLLPALLVVLVAAAAYAAFVALPDEARALRLDAVAALAFVSNWRFVFSSQGYFGQTAAPSLLRHTWSLGVEAQLYVLWPVVVVAACARFERRAVTAIAVLLGGSSAILAALLAPASGDVSRSYYGTDTRAAAFLLGAAVAGGLGGRLRKRPGVEAGVGVGFGVTIGARVGASAAVRVGVGAGAAAITAWLWATMAGTSPWLFRGGLAVAAVTSAAVVAEVVRAPASVLGRVFSVAPLRLLGRVSYGIYLWHWPIVLVLTHRRTGLSGPTLLGLRLGATAAATALSWIVVERPVLGVGRVRMPRHWQPAAVAALGAPLIAALLLPASAGAARPRPVAAGPAGVAAAPAVPAVAPPVLQAVVLGDSVAVTVGNALDPFAPDYRFGLANDATVGCGVAVGSALRTLGEVASVPGRCLTWEQDWQASLAGRPDVVVILLGRWEVLDRLVNGRWGHVGEPAFDGYLGSQLDRALNIASGSGATVVLCTAPYYAGQERPQGGTWPENDPARVDRFNVVVRAAAARHAGTVLFDLNTAVSPGGRFASTLDDVAVRSSDGVHFTPESGAFLSPRLFPALRAAADRAGAGGRTLR